MKKYCVVFENKGVIDMRAVKTFGVSAKEKDNPIGFFGTGLKYGIAILLREKHEITLLAGTDAYAFETKEIEMRDQKFEILTMNGEELPFTTRLGVNWDLWQAFRELYCNCLDEGGRVYVSDLIPLADPEKTQFIVKGQAFIELFYKKDEIVLNMKTPPINSGDQAEIFSGESSALYYRGIKVYGLPKTALFTYNILRSVDLTEDRTLKFAPSVMNDIPMVVSRLTDRAVIRRILTAENCYQENDFSYSALAWSMNASKEFYEVLIEEFEINNDKLNRSARDEAKRIKNLQIVKNYKFEEMNEVQRKQLDRAKYICTHTFKDFGDYKVLIVKTLGQSTMAMADLNERAIVLSKASFEMGTKYLVSTMIEEYLHLKTGHGDLTRAFQTSIFDHLCTVIENHVLREPI